MPAPNLPLSPNYGPTANRDFHLSHRLPHDTQNKTVEVWAGCRTQKTELAQLVRQLATH